MENSTNADELLTISETANYLKLSDKTVRRLIKDNKLMASRVGDRTWRIKKNDIQKYLTFHINGTKEVE